MRLVNVWLMPYCSLGWLLYKHLFCCSVRRLHDVQTLLWLLATASINRVILLGGGVVNGGIVDTSGYYLGGHWFA